MKKIVNDIKEEYPIYILMFILLVLHIIVLNKLGYMYTLNSDDASYVISGITFLETGKVTMHGVLSAQIMPGMTFLIALFGLIFGKGAGLWLSLKILYMILGILTVYVVYKTIRLYANKYVSILPCLFFLSLDYIWMHNIILTETPFILLFTLLIYHSLKLGNNFNKKDFILVSLYYVIALFIRPNIGIYPIFLIIYLLIKKNNYKIILKGSFITLGVVLLLLIPWTIRNYRVFHKFIPITYGAGNPLLLGTYQGSGYPTDEELDYNVVYNSLSGEGKYYLNNPEDKLYMTKYYSLEYDNLKAKYRMNEWWNKDKLSMIKSYIYSKGGIMLISAFYWKELFGVNVKTLIVFRILELIVFIISSIYIIIEKSKIKEWLFLIMEYFSQICLYLYAFAFSRYAISMYFIRYIVIGIAISLFISSRKDKKNVVK